MYRHYATWQSKLSVQKELNGNIINNINSTPFTASITFHDIINTFLQNSNYEFILCLDK